MVITYQLIPMLDLNLAYSGLDFKVSTTKKDVTGNLKWGYNGPSIGASFYFGKKSWTH